MKLNKRGFSIIEWLIAGGVIVVIGLLAAFAVSSARSHQRDATRLSTVRQVQVALEAHFHETNTYPTGQDLPLGDVTQSLCLGSEGFQADCGGDEQVFLSVIPSTIDSGLEGLVACGEPLRNAFCYTVDEDRESYGIEFELENDVANTEISEGVNCARPGEIAPGQC